MRQEFIIPTAPVPKGRPRLGRRGRVFTPKRTKNYEMVVAANAIAAGVKSTDQPVEMEIHFYMKTPTSADIDNLVKSVCDSLNGIAYVDDRQVMRLVAAKHPSKKPHTTVCITHNEPGVA